MANEGTIVVADGRLKIDAPLAKEGTVSSTGKSHILYSSGGFVTLGNGIRVNVMAIKPNGKS